MALLILTPGDPQGIGPEVVWKTLQTTDARRPNILCVGAREPFDRLGAPVIEISPIELKRGMKPPRAKKPFVWLLPAPTRSNKFLPGFQAGWSIETATKLVLDRVGDALVTGPISKERLNAGGYNFPGHTEMLAALCNKHKDATLKGRRHEVTPVSGRSRPPTPVMMLANDQLRITLVTTHLALQKVPRALNAKNITQTIETTATSLREWWGIAKPRIAVAALNPHAGEGGMFGTEEKRVITPAIEALRRRARGKYAIEGPLPADTLFANHIMANNAGKPAYDAVVCMYHDQGLVPVKLLDFPRTVNVTLGLPIVRTSVDHGTGFDIVGKGIADPSSLQSAIQLATHIVRNRR